MANGGTYTAPATAEPTDTKTGWSREGDIDPMAPQSVLRKGMGLLEQRQQAGEAGVEALQKKQQAEKPYQDKLKAIYDSPVTAHAELKKMQEAPKPEDYKKYSMEFLGAMTLVGAFASRKSRNAGNAALKAFAGAMNGWQQGNLEAYAQATKQWEENARATIENNHVELERYREILENKALNIEQMKAGLMLAGMESQNDVIVSQLRQGNIDAALKGVDMLANTQAKLEKAYGTLNGFNKANEKQLVQQASEIQYKGGQSFLDSAVQSGQMSEGQRAHWMWVAQNYGPGTDNAKRITEGVKGDPAATDEIAQAIIDGDQPPDLKGLYGNAARVRASLARKGFNLGEAQLEWTRAQKLTQSLSGPQMTRYVGLNQDVQRVIDRVIELSDKMDMSGLTMLNRAELEAEVNLRGNTPAGQLAAQYLAQITVLKEAFANLAQGGYAPTVPAFKLADRAINENYGRKEMKASLEEIRRSIAYRMQTIPGMQTMGPGAPNRYTPRGGGAAPAAPGEGAGQPVQVKTPGEAEKLPPGTLYVTPEGQRYTR